MGEENVGWTRRWEVEEAAAGSRVVLARKPGKGAGRAGDA